MDLLLTLATLATGAVQDDRAAGLEIVSSIALLKPANILIYPQRSALRALLYTIHGTDRAYRPCQQKHTISNAIVEQWSLFERKRNACGGHHWVIWWNRGGPRKPLVMEGNLWSYQRLTSLTYASAVSNGGIHSLVDEIRDYQGVGEKQRDCIQRGGWWHCRLD